MMKRILFFFLLPLLPLAIQAQQTDDEVPLHAMPVCIGYLSYDSALVQMPDYALVQHQMQELRQAYETELKRVEDEFNQKYEAFLEGRRDFPRTILLKRQNELQQLLQQNLDFKKKGQEQLKQAEQQALAPLRQKLNEVIGEVARQYALILVVNTDSNACPYIEASNSVEIFQEVVEKLKE